MLPLVSIIVPCYNQGEYLSDALESVLTQSYSNWECVIVNDGSNDTSEIVANEYCLKDNRFRYFCNNKNLGLSSARNIGIKISKGEFILPLDADDKIGEFYLKKGIQQFTKNPQTKLVYCNAQLFGMEESEWNLPDYKYSHILFENIIFCSALYKKDDYNQTTGYNETITQGLEDWDFWLSLLNESDLVYKIPEVCFYYRIRKKSMLNSLTKELQMELRHKIYFNHITKYEKFIPNLIWYNPQTKKYETEILELQKTVSRIRKSNAYRLGYFILFPIKYLSRLI